MEHNNKIIIFKKWWPLGVAFIVIIGMFFFIYCDHQWENATCISPKICSKCGKTEGDLIDHRWKDATCTNPKKCDVCSKIEGVALGHKLEKATCIAASYCKVCNMNVGVPLGHDEGEWKTGTVDYILGVVNKEKKCKICGTLTDQGSSELKSLCWGGKFMISPALFPLRVKHIFSEIGYSATMTEGRLNDGSLIYGINKNGELVAAISFTDDGNFIYESDKYSNDMSAIITYFYTDDTAEVVPIMVSMIMSCDPTLDESTARNLGKTIVNTALTGEPVKHNDVKYALSIIRNRYVFVSSVLEN